MRARIAAVLTALAWVLLAIAVVAMGTPLPDCVTPGHVYFHDLGSWLTPFCVGLALTALVLGTVRSRPRVGLIVGAVIPLIASPFVFIGTVLAYMADTC